MPVVRGFAKASHSTAAVDSRTAIQHGIRWTMREELSAKLHPDRYTAMSGKMAAIVAYILGERWTEPAISELVVTSDGFVLAQREGEVGANELIGTRADLDRNLLTLTEAAGLTPTEIRRFGELQRQRIKRYETRRG